MLPGMVQHHSAWLGAGFFEILWRGSIVDEIKTDVAAIGRGRR
jgi:hypothetical protein